MTKVNLCFDSTPELINKDNNGEYIEVYMINRNNKNEVVYGKLYRSGSVYTDNKLFNSPSGAGKYILGYDTNGWICWKNKYNEIINNYRYSKGRKTMDSKYMIDTKGENCVILEHSKTGDEISLTLENISDCATVVIELLNRADEVIVNSFEELCSILNINCEPSDWEGVNGESGSLYIYSKPAKEIINSEEDLEENVEDNIEEDVEDKPKRRVVQETVIRETVIREKEVPEVSISRKAINMLKEINSSMIDEFRNTCNELIDRFKFESMHIVEEYTVPKLEFIRKDLLGVDFDKVLKLIGLKGALLIASQPGTGKTTLAKELAYKLTCNGLTVSVGEKACSERTLMLSFNSDTSYGDTIGGPRCVNGVWVEQEGTLKKFLDAAAKDRGNNYVVILDEINRASDISSALGEILTAIEQRGVSLITNRGTELVITDNVKFIATMNTFDTSVIKLDRAIKDRFTLLNMAGTVIQAKDIKPYCDNEFINVIQLCINKVADINDILAKDPMRKNENRIGFRHFYDNYSDIEELLFMLEGSIIPSILDSLDNLEDGDIRDINRKIGELINICKER